MAQRSILFVCLGNICRSPLAEGILRHLVEREGRHHDFVIDSAGTGAWHIGDPPDRRAISVAAGHGVDISNLKARRVANDDFDRFDLILALDGSNLQTLRELAPEGSRATIELFCTHTLGATDDVPDPYFGGHADFEAVYRLLYRGCATIVEGPSDHPLS
ncbi:low molecular weight protein-tyrosine-phosphatase [Mycoplana rhizolycopersici]|uniref:protein-tyrosine-phosphatase n=1 Tax=Mycoplana rhizolycopersici TaxID=2746702 RepID=A0ABX2Q997_9HYPH|nr:low molecular weight protein-tyrosine-phosphatase [Rhizobium rhizolycopersici]NVP53876.1 low molecular weight phosphotyrosine protein phosphatase [Rhizobium rhizolycopersici]